MDQHPDTWRTRDYPVLHAVAKGVDETGSFNTRELPEQLGLSVRELFSAVRALEGRYLVTNWDVRGGGPVGVTITAITEDARRAVGMWPSAESVADDIVAVLDQRIAEAPDAVTRTRWQKLRDGVLGGGRDLLVDVVGAVVAKSITG